MRIILEGFDGTGKSTLQREIADKHNILAYTWRGPPLSIGEYHRRLGMARHAAITPVIFDRHPVISEHVYRGNGGASFDAILEELKMCRIDAVIHCTGSPMTIKPESDGTPDDDKRTEYLKKHASDYLMMYDVLMSDLSRYKPVIRFDMSEPGDTDRILNYVKTL